MFPSSKHAALVAPGIGITKGQVDHLYNLYESAVLKKDIPFLKDTVPKVTYMYLKNETGFSPGKVMGFLLAINEYAKKYGTEDWRNPLLREKRTTEKTNFLKKVITAPIDILTSAIGKGAKNITDPITKPLIAVSVIVGGGALVYGVFKLGLLKKVMRKGRK